MIRKAQTELKLMRNVNLAVVSEINFRPILPVHGFLQGRAPSPIPIPLDPRAGKLRLKPTTKQAAQCTAQPAEMIPSMKKRKKDEKIWKAARIDLYLFCSLNTSIRG